MTPLYHRLVKRLTLPVKRREPLHDPHGTLADLSDVHCFDITGALDLIDHLSRPEAANQQPHGVDRPIFQVSNEQFFIPAPRTWIEWLAPDKTRLAFFARSDDVCVVRGFSCSCCPLDALRLFDRDKPIEEDIVTAYAKRTEQINAAQATNHSPEAWVFTLITNYLAALAIINSPNIVGRTERPAHKSLARKITRKDGAAFKIHPWHEIKLEVFKPRHIDDGEPHEDRITGRRALHFCRSFLRIRLGRLEHVRSHWRGDPVLGIHQASYKVAP